MVPKSGEQRKQFIVTAEHPFLSFGCLCASLRPRDRVGTAFGIVVGLISCVSRMINKCRSCDCRHQRSAGTATASEFDCRLFLGAASSVAHPKTGFARKKEHGKSLISSCRDGITTSDASDSRGVLRAVSLLRTLPVGVAPVPSRLSPIVRICPAD